MKKWIAVIITINILVIGFAVIALYKISGEKNVQPPSVGVVDIAPADVVESPPADVIVSPPADVIVNPPADVIDDLPAFVRVTLYGALLEDGGRNGSPIGCGDSLAPVREYDSEQFRYQVDSQGRRTVPSGVVKEALSELFLLEVTALDSDKNEYTSAYQPDLKVDKAEVTRETANVFLVGSASFGGVCDLPRFKEQLNATVDAFEGISVVRFYLNGSEEAYQEIFSLR